MPCFQPVNMTQLHFKCPDYNRFDLRDLVPHALGNVTACSHHNDHMPILSLLAGNGTFLRGADQRPDAIEANVHRQARAVGQPQKG